MTEPTDHALRFLQMVATKAAVSGGWLDADDLPLNGCCAAVACMVRGMFGGELMEGMVDGAPHYWNRLKDGREVDLTAVQFGSAGLDPVAEGFPVQHDQVGIHDMLFARDVYEELTKDKSDEPA